uniref:Uncharacterized protein n=1 Tax=Triticum urartu TaxID=4572 RepID=A0A8R7PQG6_TRIUA
MGSSAADIDHLPEGPSHGCIGEIVVGYAVSLHAAGLWRRELCNHVEAAHVGEVQAVAINRASLTARWRRELCHHVEAAHVGEVQAVALLQPHHELQVPHHVLHGRPVGAALRQAPGHRLAVLPQRRRPRRGGDAPVHDLLQLAPALPVQPPLHQVRHGLRQPRVDDGPRADGLQQHDAQRVHVGLGRQLPRPAVLRVDVPEAALHRRADVRLVQHRPGLGQPEVGHLAREVAVQQDVGRLDVAVDHRLVHGRVQVKEAPRRAGARLQPLRPAQRRRAAAAVQPAPQRAALHVLVQQDHLLPLVAVSDERHKVAVAQPGQQLDLRAELPRALPRLRARALHGDLSAVLEHGAVHLAEPSLSDDQAVVEVARRVLQHGERETVARHHRGGSPGAGSRNVTGSSEA